MADRRGGNQSRLCLGACRCLGENEADRQASQKSKTLEQSKKRPHAIIIRGTHDDRTHSGQVLQNAPTRPGQHRRARKRGTSPSARVHRGRAAQTRHRPTGGCHGHAPERRPTSTRRLRRPAIAAIRPGGSFHRGRHGRPTIRAGLHVILPATVSPESRIAVANHPRQSRATSTLKEEHACLDPVWAPYL